MGSRPSFIRFLGLWLPKPQTRSGKTSLAEDAPQARHTTIRGLPRPLARAMERYPERLDVEQVRKAYEMAAEAHEGQKRASGEDYVTHVVEVATLLAQFKLDTASLVSALIHDVVEDTPITLTDIEEEFGYRGRSDRGWGHQDRQGGVPVPHRATGRELPEASPLHGPGCPGHPHQAGGSPPQHADAGAPGPGKAKADRPGDPGDLCAPGPPPGDGGPEVGAGGPGLQVPGAGGL